MNKNSQRKKVVVLGGQGFLGSHVMRLLEQKRYEPISLSKRSGVDGRNFESLSQAIKKIQPDIIINCAAHVGSVHYAMEFGADMIHDNILLVANLYRSVLFACPKAKIINPISNCSYPGDANTHYEPDWEKGAVHESVLAYASTRRLIYALAFCYAKQYNIHSVNWLVANAYGPGDYSDPNKVHALNGIIIRLLKAQQKNDETFEIWGSGKPTREWVYIEDVAKMLVDSVEMKDQIYPVNLAQNKAYSIAEIAEIVAKALNYSVKFVFNTKYADGAPFKVLDDRKFRKKFPSFKFTPINIGIKNTINYYKRSLSGLDSQTDRTS